MILKPFQQKMLRIGVKIDFSRGNRNTKYLAMVFIFFYSFEVLGEPSSYVSVPSVLKSFEKGWRQRGAAVSDIMPLCTHPISSCMSGQSHPWCPIYGIMSGHTKQISFRVVVLWLALCVLLCSPVVCNGYCACLRWGVFVVVLCALFVCVSVCFVLCAAACVCGCVERA